jgi:leucyl aminopeptidase
MLLIPTTLTSELVGALRRGLALAEGIALSKELDDLRGQLSTTSVLANAAMAMGEEFRFPVDVVERNPLRTVGRQTPPSAGETPASDAKMIVMHYKGRRAKNRPIVLAGTGTPVTLNGASCVLGALKAAARLRLPINVVGLVALAGCAKRRNVSPSDTDVVPVSRQEIDALDRPSELRSSLCEMFAYAERFVPSSMIGIATLAASVAAVCARNLYANDTTLAAELLKSSEESGGRAWRVHLWDDRTDRIESYWASTGDVDAMRAASLLRCSAKTYSWGYLDIEETASDAVQPENKVDCLVALLADFLINRAAEAALSMPEARGGRKTHNRGVVL